MVCKKVIIFLSILFFSTYLFAEEIKDYTIIEKRLSQLEKGLNSPGHKFHDFEEVKRIWRQVVDNTPSVLAKGEEQGAQNFRESFYKHLEILLWSSQVRSDYLQKIHNGESGTIFELSLPFFDDLGRELKLVPLKWYAIGYLKVQYIKKKLEGGFDGIKILVYDLCIFAIVLFIPVFFWRISKKILASIQKVRTKLLRKSYHRRSFSLYAELLKYIIDYLPWFVALYSLSLASELLHSSNFSELSIFVPFVTYFIWFKISQKVFSDALLKVAKYKKGSDVSLIKEKASRNASQVSFVVFISFSLIYAIESVVSKGLSFYIVNYISTAVITFVLFLTARDWKEEIAQKVSDYDIPHVSSWLEKSLLRKTWFFLCLPVLVIIISVNIITAILEWSERFDTVKKITAQIFKHRLENSEIFKESELKELPEDYRKIFEKDVEEEMDLYVSSKNNSLEVIKKQVKDWVDDKLEENSLVVVGEKGSGKTTVLSLAEKNISGAQVIRANMPSRILSKSQMVSFIGHLLGIPMESDYQPLIDADSKLEKTVIILDESQNSFISEVGGLEGFKTLLDLVNARLENVFFIFSFNSFAWSYLSAAFGKNQNFRTIITIKPFSDDDIRNLIMVRHEKSSYELSFNEILMATKGTYEVEGMEAVEEQFFRLLWEQSLGNPKVSLYMWLSALKYRGGQSFRVGLPHDDEVEVLSTLSDDALFIYAAIVKHENLSSREVLKITNLSEGVVRFALKLGLDHALLVRKKATGHYTVNVRFQHTIVNYLKKKNLVYAW